MKSICTAILLPALAIMLSASPGICREKDDLFNAVAALNIQRHGYVLGAKLTEAQKAAASRNPVKASSPKVYQFTDKGLNIVADPVTHRVLVLFEQFEGIGQKKIREKVGDLFMAFGDPTVSAHDQVVYWAWGSKEKFTQDQYNAAKENKQPLSVIATVKLNSEIKIMEAPGEKTQGNAYYIISSDPLLKFFAED